MKQVRVSVETLPEIVAELVEGTKVFSAIQ